MSVLLTRRGSRIVVSKVPQIRTVPTCDSDLETLSSLGRDKGCTAVRWVEDGRREVGGKPTGYQTKERRCLDQNKY